MPDARVRLFPQHVVGGVQQNRRVQRIGQFRCHGHVVVVAVGADDGLDRPAGNRIDDRGRGVCCVDDHHLVVVADQPDVVVDVPGATVEAERAGGDDVLDAELPAHRTTTERRTVP